MKARVRMYRQGLGDCFLLSFDTGPESVHVLIDCGTLGATTTGVSLDDVVDDIAEETGRHLHLLVLTHEHKDHVSGFGSQQRRDVFDQFVVDRVWVAWTENPNDELAKTLAKYEEDLLLANQLAARALLENRAVDQDERAALRELGSGVQGLLDFYGDDLAAADFAETVHEAMNYASMLSQGPPEYREPGDLIEPEWLPGVRFYVLGPPRSKEAIEDLGSHDSPELYHISGQLAADLTECTKFHTSRQPFGDYRSALDPVDRQSFERGLPFDPRFRVEENNREARARHLAAYDDSEQAWRRIDHDWLTAAGDLALQLDSFTNNTSLALAIELLDDGRVLLFPADAQLGNWLTWHDLEWEVTEPDGTERRVKATDLLKRTFLYKVGHHASHNATVNELGLELMERDDLIAMIPVDRAVALKKKPVWKMPAQALYQRLLEKTQGRVLRSDTGWPEEGQDPPTDWNPDWETAQDHPDVTIDDLFIELRLD